MEKEFEKGLLFRNLPVEVDRSDGLSTQLDLRTDLALLIAEFGEHIKNLRVLTSNMFDTNSAVVTFRNKNLDLNNVKDCFDGLIYKDWAPLFVEVIEIRGFFQARRKREETDRAIHEKITLKVPLKKTDGGSGGLNRSHSSPNIAKMLEDEDPVSGSGQANVPIPKFDRTSKPSSNKNRNFEGIWGVSKKGLLYYYFSFHTTRNKFLLKIK